MAVAAFPGLAAASTTIGQTSGSGVTCTIGGTHVTWTTGPDAPDYIVPAAGVITSWTNDPGSATGTSTRLEVIRPSASNTVVGESSIQNNIPANNTAPFPTQIAVQAGDEIGLELTSTPGACITAATGDNVHFGVDNGPGNPVATTGVISNYRSNVAATITAPPKSSVSVTSCPQSTVKGTVTADSGTTAKSLNYRIDGGAEQVAPTTGNPGLASITVPAGLHSLEYWGEDQPGQQESPHHVTQVGCAAHVVSASESHHRFRASGKPKLAHLSRKGPPVGTTFKFNLDLAASVRFDFTQPRAGRTVNGKCVAKTKHNAHKRKCALLAGSLTFAGHAGLDKVTFNGWLSHGKKLKPGKYTLVITASVPGATTSKTLKFKIVR